MFCTNCGQAQAETANFCAKCGKRVRAENFSPAQDFTQASGFAAARAAERKLVRPLDDKWLAGVCSAFARYLNVDLALVRILWLSAVILFGTGILAYLICWLIIPREQPGVMMTQTTT